MGDQDTVSKSCGFFITLAPAHADVANRYQRERAAVCDL
jgi:hypothetical protein